MPSVGSHEFKSSKIITKYKGNVVVGKGQLNTLSLNCGWCHLANSSDCYSKKSI